MHAATILPVVEKEAAGPSLDARFFFFFSYFRLQFAAFPSSSQGAGDFCSPADNPLMFHPSPGSLSEIIIASKSLRRDI